MALGFRHQAHKNKSGPPAGGPLPLLRRGQDKHETGPQHGPDGTDARARVPTKQTFAGPDGGQQTWGEREEPHAAGPDCRESRTKMGPHIKRETVPAFPAGGPTGGGTGAPDNQ